MLINGYACTYRNYGNFTIVYCNANHNHFILQNAFQYFFQCVYGEGQESHDVIKNVANQFNIDEQTIQNDYDQFVKELIQNCTPNPANPLQGKKEAVQERPNDKFIYDIMTKSMIPYSATIELTDACNLRCVHCYRGKPEKSYWNIATMQQLLQQLQEMGTMHITITGGEPFMHPDCAKILELIGEMGFVLSVQTNATMDIGYLAEYAEKYPIKEISISLYSTVNDTHDTITTVPGSLAQTLKSIKFLASHHVPVSINCPVMTLNMNDMEPLQKYCDQKGIPCHFAFKIIPAQENSKDTKALNCFSAALLAKYMKNDTIRLYQNILGDIRKSKPGCRYCQTGFRSITLDAQGNVLICNAYRKKCGNIKEQTLPEIWSNSHELNGWRNILSKVNDKCKNCPAYAYCEPCPAHAYTLTGDDTKIDDITCAFGTAFYQADSENKIEERRNLS